MASRMHLIKHSRHVHRINVNTYNACDPCQFMQYTRILVILTNTCHTWKCIQHKQYMSIHINRHQSEYKRIYAILEIHATRVNPYNRCYNLFRGAKALQQPRSSIKEGFLQPQYSLQTQYSPNTNSIHTRYVLCIGYVQTGQKVAKYIIHNYRRYLSYHFFLWKISFLVRDNSWYICLFKDN